MKHAYFIRFRITTLLLVCIVISCNKFVQVPPPKTQLVTSNVFSSDASANSVIAGIYSNMQSSGFASGNFTSVTCLSGLSADELVNYTNTNTGIQFYQNGIFPTNQDLNSNLWASAYQYIYAANEAITGLTGSTAVGDSVKNQLIGEAQFIRAFCHFYLVNLFGDVPSITTADYNQNSNVARTPVSQVYQQIIADLKSAQNLLAADYSVSKGERIRPNKWTATALLARAYLYTQKWDSALVEASAVIGNSSLYSLDSLNAVFVANSTEAIWQFGVIYPSPTNEGSLFILAGVPSNVAMNNQLLNSFEAGDNRRSDWVDSVSAAVTGTQTYYYPFKYKVQDATNSSEYSMIMRLAEQFLIRAEAEANGVGDGISAAITDLNVIRNRAGLANYGGATDQHSVLSAILHERQVELFTEWGHRWLDLKRTNSVDSVMSVVTPQKGGGTWSHNWALYPIPLVQIQNDPAMAGSQNPGY